MSDYLFTNISITCLVLISFILLRNAPARLRLYLLITALIAWLIPWQTLSIASPAVLELSAYKPEIFDFSLWGDNQTISTEITANIAIIEPNNTQVVLSQFVSDLPFSSELIISCLFVIGLLLLCKDIWQYQRQITLWLKNSTPLPDLYSKYQIPLNDKEQHIPVCLVKDNGPGMATGIFKPIIWLANYQHDTNHSKTIITHELNHIRQHDPLWMWSITIIQRLLWWNPIAFYLAELAREQIELSCDEKCANQLREDYSYQLAEIVLTTSQPSSKGEQLFSPTLGIKRSNSFNIKRLKRLSRMHEMKIKYLVVAILTLTLSAFSALGINSKSVNSSSAQISHENHSSKVKNHKRPKMQIYSEHSDYNQLIDEVLVLAQQAQSMDKNIIENIYVELYQWHSTRTILEIDSLEKRLKGLEFTLFNYLLTKLERYDEILSLYKEMFPEQSTPDKFFKHHIALAYSYTGQAEQAIELMTSFAQQQPLKYRVGSLSLLSYVYWAAEDYQQVINTSEEILILSPGVRSEISSLSAKYHAYNKLDQTVKADKMKEKLVQDYGREPLNEPQSPRFHSPFLDHLPKVKS